MNGTNCDEHTSNNFSGVICSGGMVRTSNDESRTTSAAAMAFCQIVCARNAGDYCCVGIVELNAVRGCLACWFLRADVTYLVSCCFACSFFTQVSSMGVSLVLLICFGLSPKGSTTTLLGELFIYFAMINASLPSPHTR